MLKNGIIGATILAVTSSTAVISNKALIFALNKISNTFQTTQSTAELPSEEAVYSGILGSIDDIGANSHSLFLVGLLAFSAPIIYRYLQDEENNKKYLVAYLIPVTIYALIWFGLRSITFFGKA